MCPGTLFMIKFVNLMETKYPFADNLSPVTALVGILGREDRLGLAALAWMFARFGRQFPQAFLATEAEEISVGTQLLNLIQSDKHARSAIADLYRKLLHKPDTTESDIKQILISEDFIAALIERLFRTDPSLGEWVKVLDSASGGTSSANAPDCGTLSIIASNNTDARAGCIKIAEGRWNVGAQVVVLGHTHLPQTVGGGHHRYYNPGSWTRYVETTSTLTLKQLEDESKFPYQLSYVRVEDTGDKILRSEMIVVERGP